MGQEARCKAVINGVTFDGKAHLETSELTFRGGTRLNIPFKDIRRAQAEEGALTVAYGTGEAVFHLGAAAPRWAAKILNPPSRADKLGIQAGTRILWRGAPDENFKNEARAKGATFVRANPDVTFLVATEVRDLAKVGGGPVWIIYPKGVQHIRESDVRGAGLAAGLVDVKVVKFSETHTALKFVARSGAAKRAAARA